MNLIIKITDVMGNVAIKTDYKQCEDFNGDLVSLHAAVVKAVGDIFIKAAELHNESEKNKGPE